MKHVEAGVLIALRDGALVDGDAAAHVDACARCQAALEELERRAVSIANALSAFEAPVDVDAAKASVRRRMDAARATSERHRPAWTRHLARAAAAVVLVSGAAYALPGSPLATWLSGTRSEPAAATSAETQARPEAADEAGIEVNVADGRIAVALTGVEAGTPIEVTWIDAATASISAASGSAFTFADARAEARVSPGPVRVELPRFAPIVSLSVDGRVYLRRDGGPLELAVTPVERTDDKLRYVVDGG